RLHDAVAACRAVMAVLPDQPDARHLLGLAYYRLGRLEEAERELARAVALRPLSARFAGHHGAVLGDLGRVVEAIAALENALSLDPQSPMCCEISA
ncbi:MAG: tetratricopeptide repeat protein, partial [Alphaproteobacteria bacterium]|nr:tetratricopeptide repeat protein [Alphaproteobacteria bacterium]